ncbi:hypothetical protein TTHERM_00716120 (macronuclear) [Tetrahymena thermophila SB210]|uniref:Uncharacterized protein n=1 Tax=Tetrahymena thermophila (strain SB210) TaxID=312017 RepID=I7LZM9_TETTS|nr:hypothetical protein TTHERM_00716120 [Tetrahymena thermophila SB210]EAR84306.1 hypothetical protein TTHERM_00716120 [Tetrahymena thermophila SB210]|eukprot:XP_001031969.1 hypothetical protein TTHERM_00716120 [Tetrahymena thermophila SB210]
MFRDTQEDYLRYLLFDDQDDDFNFFNSGMSQNQPNNNNMDQNMLYNQNDQILETENNPFSTNSVYNNHKINEYEKQQEEINQHLTEMTLNSNNINDPRFQNTNIPVGDNYRNGYPLNNNNSNQSNIENAAAKYNGLSYDIRDGQENSRYIDYGNQVNNGVDYYPKQAENGISENNNNPLNQSLYMQQTHLNGNQYNNYPADININKGQGLSYDNRIGSPVPQQSNPYYQQSPQQTLQQPNQQYDIISSPSQQPANPYNEEYQNSNYYPNEQIPRENRNYFNLTNQEQNNNRYYGKHEQVAAADSNQYEQGLYNQNNNYQQQGNYTNQNNINMNGAQEYYSNQNRQYSQNQDLNKQQTEQFYAPQQNQNMYRNSYNEQISNGQPIYNNQLQQPYYDNYKVQDISVQQQQSQATVIGQVPILKEMRMSKRKSTSKQSNGSQLSKKSSVKEAQQQKYEKKYQKAQQSQKLQQQIINSINQKNQLSSSATTLQYNGQGANVDSINASQYSSTDNNVPTEAVSSNSTAYTTVQFNNSNSNQINNVLTNQNSYQSAYYNEAYNEQSHPHHHHCCHEEDDSDSEDSIQNEEMDQHEHNHLLHSGIQNSSQLNDSNSNDEGKNKCDLSCDQEGDSEKNSKADEIAILAESIKHCNKKNVVKNIMSAFLTFMNDRKNKIYTKQEQETIPTLYYSQGKEEGSTEDEDQIEEIRKKFKRYISQKSLNHYTVRLLILHPNYGPIFKHYLTNPIKKWINNSKVADLGAHIKMIGFFLACFQDNRVLEELKRHEKKRAHFS